MREREWAGADAAGNERERERYTQTGRREGRGLASCRVGCSLKCTETVSLAFPVCSCCSLAVSSSSAAARLRFFFFFFFVSFFRVWFGSFFLSSSPHLFVLFVVRVGVFLEVVVVSG